MGRWARAVLALRRDEALRAVAQKHDAEAAESARALAEAARGAGAAGAEGDQRRARKSQNSKRPGKSNGYCRPSLGLGNTARAEILEGDVEIQLEPRSWRETFGEH